MNPGQQMTILGLVALGYYGTMLATGLVGTEVMPLFIVSAILFLSSGRLLRKASAKKKRESDDDPETRAKAQAEEEVWALRTQILNWVMTGLILTALGLWVMKPVGVSFFEMFSFH